MAWSKYIEIKYALAGIPAENLTDYSKLFVINSTVDPVASASIAAECSSGGGYKITSADGSVDLAFGDYANLTDLTAGEVGFRVKLTLLTAASVGDDYCRLYYSSSETTVDDKAGATSALALFMPLEEDPSGSAPQMRGWVSDTLIGTSAGSMTSGDLVTGQVGKGLDFDGSNDVISVSSTPFSVGTQTDFTVEINFSNVSIGGANQDRMIRLSTLSGSTNLVLFKTDFGNTLRAALTINGGVNTLVSTSSIAGAGWKRAAYVRRGTSHELYIDGVLEASATHSLGTHSVATGTWYLGGDPAFPVVGWNGVLDEWVVASVARSANWLAYAKADDFANATTFTLSAEQGGGGGGVNRRRRLICGASA